jgi:bifunctional DNA-binding transcriptional regulator/antitoxin component of YhaV-PrlF toxin-antitoxin module
MKAAQHLEMKVYLRAKNQLTLPEPIAQELGVRSGDELILSVEESEPHVVRLRPVLRSYAGIAAGIYGSPDEVAAYIQGERASWGE